MHYTVDYSKFTDETVKVRAACADTLAYLGPKRFKMIVALVKADREKEVDFALMIVGVRGFPGWALWKRYNPKALS